MINGFLIPSDVAQYWSKVCSQEHYLLIQSIYFLQSQGRTPTNDNLSDILNYSETNSVSRLLSEAEEVGLIRRIIVSGQPSILSIDPFLQKIYCQNNKTEATQSEFVVLRNQDINITIGHNELDEGEEVWLIDKGTEAHGVVLRTTNKRVKLKILGEDKNRLVDPGKYELRDKEGRQIVMGEENKEEGKSEEWHDLRSAVIESLIGDSENIELKGKGWIANISNEVDLMIERGVTVDKWNEIIAKFWQSSTGEWLKNKNKLPDMAQIKQFYIEYKNGTHKEENKTIRNVVSEFTI